MLGLLKKNMSFKHTVSLETAKRLHAVGFKNERPALGDIFYTIHPDTNQIDAVVVGSAKWHMSALLEMYFAASATDILQRLGQEYHLCCVGGKNWIVEKEINTRFGDDGYDYVTESFPIENDENPSEALARVFIEIHGEGYP